MVEQMERGELWNHPPQAQRSICDDAHESSPTSCSRPNAAHRTRSVAITNAITHAVPPSPSYLLLLTSLS